jgi:hypothetical protein
MGHAAVATAASEPSSADVYDVDFDRPRLTSDTATFNPTATNVVIEMSCTRIK